MEIRVGDRVMWESQAAGSWKRKIGTVIEVQDKNLCVEVDTVVNFDPESWKETGERKLLKTAKRYYPRKRFCKIVQN